MKWFPRSKKDKLLYGLGPSTYDDGKQLAELYTFDELQIRLYTGCEGLAGGKEFGHGLCTGLLDRIRRGDFTDR